MSDEKLAEAVELDRHIRMTRELEWRSARIRDLEGEVARLQAERDGLQRELSLVDSVLARRPALDRPTRFENIEKAISVAARADKAESELAEAKGEHAREINRWRNALSQAVGDKAHLEAKLSEAKAKLAEAREAIGCGGSLTEPCIDAIDPCWEHRLEKSERLVSEGSVMIVERGRLIRELEAKLAESERVAAERVGADPEVRAVLLEWMGTTEPKLLYEAFMEGAEAASLLEGKLAESEQTRRYEKELHATTERALEARLREAEAERDEARATKDMHKERQEQEIELRLRAEAALDEATKRCEELQWFVKTIETDAESGGIGNLSPFGKLTMYREQARRLLYRQREALRSTPAAKTLRCERCGYCRGEVVCTHCGTPATSSGLSEDA